MISTLQMNVPDTYRLLSEWLQGEPAAGPEPGLGRHPVFLLTAGVLLNVEERFGTVEQTQVERSEAPPQMYVIPVAKRAQDQFSDQIWVGREPICDVWLPMGSISKLHARIVSRAGTFELMDTRSTNGTFVNDVRLGTLPVVLNNQDRVRFGPVEVVFYTPEGLLEMARQQQVALHLEPE